MNEKTKGKFNELVNNCCLSSGGTRLLFNSQIEDFKVIAVSDIGDTQKWDSLDEINGIKENVRNAASSAAKQLQALKVDEIHLEDFDNNADSAAEGAILGSFRFQPYKEESKRTKIPVIAPAAGIQDLQGWKRGETFAQAQNFCKSLMEAPANLMTPTIFTETVEKKFLGLSNVNIQAHDEEWARNEKMNLFLSVTAGSSEPAKFLEITYNGGDKDQAPIALVGKGITFDSGGISLKPSSKMDQMRGDMGGAANVVSTIWAIAQLNVPVNVKGFVPLCENLPGNYATKPGDVIFGRNGKSVAIDNTDAEGRLILSDALSYASDFKPRFILDCATLTGAVRVSNIYLITFCYHFIMVALWLPSLGCSW